MISSIGIQKQASNDENQNKIVSVNFKQTQLETNLRLIQQVSDKILSKLELESNKELHILEQKQHQQLQQIKLINSISLESAVEDRLLQLIKLQGIPTISNDAKHKLEQIFQIFSDKQVSYAKQLVVFYQSKEFICNNMNEIYEGLKKKGVPNYACDAFRHSTVSKIQTDGKELAVELIICSPGADCSRANFESRSNMWVHSSYYSIYCFNENGDLLKYDFTGDCFKYLIPRPIKEQYGSGIQHDLLKDQPKMITFPDTNSSTDYTNIKEFQDACLRPEVPLKEIVRKWDLVWQCVHESSSSFIGLQLVRDYIGNAMQPELYLFNELKNVLTQMLKIADVKEIRDALKSDRYNIDILMEKPHIWIMMDIFNMYNWAQNFVSFIKMDDNQVQRDVIVLKVARQRAQELIQVESKLMLVSQIDFCDLHSLLQFTENSLQKLIQIQQQEISDYKRRQNDQVNAIQQSVQTMQNQQCKLAVQFNSQNLPEQNANSIMTQIMGEQ